MSRSVLSRGATAEPTLEGEEQHQGRGRILPPVPRATIFRAKLRHSAILLS
jgi:hypothetical protein